MRKVIFSVATVAALLVGSATAFADGPTSQQPNSGMPSSSQSSQTQVTIQNSQFMPASLTVWQGTTVTWVNQDTMDHTVTSDGATGSVQFNSGTLAPGQRYSYTFSQTGTYTYHCSIHPQMTGSVTVMSQPPQPAPTKANQPAASAQANASATVNTYNSAALATPPKRHRPPPLRPQTTAVSRITVCRQRPCLAATLKRQPLPQRRPKHCQIPGRQVLFSLRRLQ